MRGLYYSDRRVQFAAVNALLKMPYRGAPADSIRVVEVLRRFLAAEPAPRTMVAMCPKEQVLKTEKAFKLGGFENVDIRCETLAETFEKLRQSADYDVIFIHPCREDGGASLCGDPVARRRRPGPVAVDHSDPQGKPGEMAKDVRIGTPTPGSSWTPSSPCPRP